MSEMLLDHIGDAHTIIIAGHINPDGDCIGSCLGVYNYLTKKLPDVDIRVHLNTIPTIFNFLKGADTITPANEKDDTVHDLFIALDCGDLKRLGPSAGLFKNAKRTICIDHHLSNSAFADFNYVFPDASSTCELICDLIPEEDITFEIAECLYTGMVHDTGVFQYSCTSSKTMNVAGMLMDKGIDYPGIVDRTYFSKTFDQNRILGQALLNAKLYADGDCIASVITQKEMRAYNVSTRHLEGIVAQLRCTKGVEVAIFCYETESGSYRVSTRASGDVNLALLAQGYGGGGHAKAAGFFVTGDPWEAIEGIVKKVEDELALIRAKNG